MNIVASIVEALEILSSNKVRSGLTMLGIIIGVGAVIALMSLGSGLESSIAGEINHIGTNLIYVSSGGEARNPEPLTLDDAEAIGDSNLAPSVLHVAPTLQGQVEATTAGESLRTTIVGVNTDYFVVQNTETSEGRLITAADLTSRAAMVLLGSNAADELFGRTTGVVGERVRIQGQPYQVIGVLKEQGGSALGSSDSQILMPLTTAQLRVLRRSTHGQVDQIQIQAVSAEAVPEASDEVAQILRSRHRTTLGEDDFNILSTQTLLDFAESITGTITMFLGGIAAISLLVGGIGIMNIMLVTVVERTREIGLRKALGARKRDILAQFLVESSLLSLVGGMIGIMVGWGLALVVGQLAASLGSSSIHPVVELPVVLLATLFSASVGLFFGLYPANRAANLEPVEALRSE